MRTLKQLCTPRPSVFDSSRRDVVLDLTDLIDNRINPDMFFEENFLTDGMKRLLQQAFRRFSDASEQGAYVLTQAMGGGKTHNMIALGLLAKHPALRRRVMGDLYQSQQLDEVRVVAFTGRESDAPYGVWGAIADQLGKRDLFKEYYEPLSAPGQSAWIRLLQGKPLLILLDELPPYFEYAKSRQIGNSDLAQVTTTALSNLLVALGKAELSNVCVVISDLRATYEGGSQSIVRALENFKSEVGRGAMMLEPVAMNTDEIYHILRKRLFEELPDETDIREVAQGYAQAVRDAKQMDITNASPEKFAQQIRDSYPFHFSIKDLYARFRENPGFQQTRGLIRLMRVVVARLFEDQGAANRLYLIHPHDIDLNDRSTLAEIMEINPKLGNAISRDIASDGKAFAEIIDANRTGTDAQDVAKLLLISSLANVPDAVVGLSLSEIVSYLCAPRRDLSKIPREVVDPLLTKAWYLHTNQLGKLYFRDVQNLVAKIKTVAEGVNRESSLRELRAFLRDTFTPSLKDCYQEVQALPPIDEIDPRQEKVTLVICEPSSSGGLSPDIQSRFAQLDYKNRVLFLSGTRTSLDSLLDVAAEQKAIKMIIEELRADRNPDGELQRKAASELAEKVELRLRSAVREAFTTLYFPLGSDKLMTADFLMNFVDSTYVGEHQIRETLKAKQKFTEDITGDIFRRKCELRLFTQPTMLWSEVLRRAATNTAWQWHRPDALDALRDDLVSKDQWRAQGTMVERGPFPPPSTEVRYQVVHRDDETAMATLKLTAVNGDTVYFEIGGTATTASEMVPDLKQFLTDALEVSFLCVDSTGEHETGAPMLWRNEVTLKSRIFQDGSQRKVEFHAIPSVPIKYSIDGSDPQVVGLSYSDVPVGLPSGTRLILAIAEQGGRVYATHSKDVQESKAAITRVDPVRPAKWLRRHEPKTTKESYELLERMKKHQARSRSPRITVAGKTWVEFSSDQDVVLQAEQLESIALTLRGLLTEGQVAIESIALEFLTGQHLLDWVADVKTQLEPEEVVQ